MNVISLCALYKQNLENTDNFRNIEAELKKNSWYKSVLDFSEMSTNINRVYIASIVASLLLMILILQLGFVLISSTFYFFYPLYKTLSMLENPNICLLRNWLLYWLIYTTVNAAEHVLFFLDWMPGFSFLKFIFFIWCYVPLTTKGCDWIYCNLLQPFFQNNHETLENIANHILGIVYLIYADSNPNFESNLQTQQQHSIYAESPMDIEPQLPVSCTKSSESLDATVN